MDVPGHRRGEHRVAALMVEREGFRSEWRDVPVAVRDELDAVLGSP